MAYQVLARKLRPKTFSQVIGQTHVTEALKNALSNNQVGHAYIFAGTRGVGKTTVARLLAACLRCEHQSAPGTPCGECENCLDCQSESALNVIEIDGASNNSVENIRELISNVQYLPTTGQYKIYIIDEVHMLSISAFNALLKTLESPPPHIIFIFATTELHKIPETVRSRCQIFEFRSQGVEGLNQYLMEVAKDQGIHFAHEGLTRELATAAKGSVRDMLSLLEQVLTFSGGEVIDENLLAQSIGLAQSSQVTNLAFALLSGDVACVSRYWRQFMEQNLAPNTIVEKLMSQLMDFVFHQSGVESNLSSESVEKFKSLNLGPGELIWVTEVLAQDFTWALKAPMADKVIELVLHKMTVRKEVLDASSQHIPPTPIPQKTNGHQAAQPTATPAEKKSLLANARSMLQNAGTHNPHPPKAEEPKEETKKEEVGEAEIAKAPEPVKRVGPKNWENFLDHLRTISPVTAANIEQGNLLTPLDYSVGLSLWVHLGFKRPEKVFYDYLHQVENEKKVREYLQDYFELSEDKIRLKLELVLDQKMDATFRSRVEQERDAIQKKREEMKNELLNDPLIQKAEELFNTKVERVILS